MLRHVLPELYDANLPFLRDGDMRLLEEVYEEIENQYLLKNLHQDDDDVIDKVDDIDEALVENIQIVKDNFVTIIRVMEFGGSSKREFIKSFPIWRKTRLSNVDALREIGKSLHVDRKNSNISRLVGNSVSFLGGALMVTSAVLIPFTLGATMPLTITGGVAIGAGSTTNIGTSITENVLLSQKIKKSNAIIKEEEKSRDNLNSWLIHTTEVTAALEKISNIDVMKNIMDEIKHFVMQAINIKNGKRRSIVKFLAKTAICILGGQCAQAISACAMLISMLAAIITLHERNRLIFDCVSLTFRGVLAILSVLDSTIDTAEMVVKALIGNSGVAAGIGKTIARSAVSVLGMSLDVAGIVLTSIDIHSGSLSEHGQKIINTAENLSKEVDVLQDVFDSLQSRAITI